MANIFHLVDHFKTDHRKNHPLQVVSLMIFFWILFDGVVSFIAPLVITQAGISDSTMGLILGFSSGAGIIFDFLLCKYIKNTNYRRIYLLAFIISIIYPFFLWQGKSVSMFLLFSAVWGLAYDLVNVGNLDFVGHHLPEEEHSSAFGIIYVFHGLGYLLAPLVTGLIIGEVVGFKPFLLMWIFLIISILFYAVLLLMKKDNHLKILTEGKNKSIFRELVLWEKIGTRILPILFLTLMINIIGSFYWTIGPLLTASNLGMGKLGGFFLVTYELPPFLLGWFVGSITNKFGNRKTAFWSLLCGSILLSSFFMINQPILLLLVSFCACFFFAFAWPSAKSIYADFVSEAPLIEKEIETIEDSVVNIGYIIGPIFAGIAIQFFGHLVAFSMVGVLGILTAIILISFTPKKLKLTNQIANEQ